MSCPSPKPRLPRLANVRAVLTGRKKLRTRREAKVVGILWPSTLPGGTRFSGGGGRPTIGCVLVEREMSESLVIVREVAGQETAQVPFAKDEYLIQTLAPDRADEPYHEGILPRTPGRLPFILCWNEPP